MSLHKWCRQYLWCSLDPLKSMLKSSYLPVRATLYRVLDLRHFAAVGMDSIVMHRCIWLGRADDVVCSGASNGRWQCTGSHQHRDVTVVENRDRVHVGCCAGIVVSLKSKRKNRSVFRQVRKGVPRQCTIAPRTICTTL